MGVGAEVHAGHGGDARLVEQERADVGGAAQHPALAALAEEAGDVREGVERALRHHAAHPGDRVEPLHDDVTPPVELARHLGHLVLRAAQRLDRGPLGDRGGVGRDLALHVGHRADDRLGAGRVADAPAGHRVRLRARVDHDGARLDLGRERRDRDVTALVGERLVALVGDDPEIALDRELRHLGERGAGEHRAGRVARAVEHDHLRPGGDRRPQRGRVEVEPGRLLRDHRHRHPAQEPHLLRVGHPVGARDQHLVPRVHQRHHDVVEGVLRPAGDGHLVRSVLEPVVALELLAHRGAQLGDPADLGVLGLPLLDRADRGGLDPGGGVEIGLPRAEGDHVDPLRAHGPGLGLHREGRRGGKRLHAVGEHGVLSSQR